MYTVEAYDMNNLPANKSALVGTPETLNVAWVGFSLPSARLRLKVDTPSNYTHFKLTYSGKTYIFEVVSMQNVGELTEYNLYMDFLKTFFLGSMTGYNFHVLRSNDSNIWDRKYYDPMLPLKNEIEVYRGTGATVTGAGLSLYLVMPNAYPADSVSRAYDSMKSVKVAEVQSDHLADVLKLTLLGSTSANFLNNVIKAYIAPAVANAYESVVEYVKPDGNIEPTNIPCKYHISNYTSETYSLPNLTDVFGVQMLDFTYRTPIVNLKVYAPLLNEYINIDSSIYDASGYIKYIYNFADGTAEAFFTDNYGNIVTSAGVVNFPTFPIASSDFARSMYLSNVNMQYTGVRMVASALTGNFKGAIETGADAMQTYTMDALNAGLSGVNVSGYSGQSMIFRDRQIKVIALRTKPAETPQNFAVNHGYYINGDLGVDSWQTGALYILDSLPYIRGARWYVEGVNNALQEGFIY